jgi:hypothetical protein
MRKQIISKDEDKLNIVILSNEDLGIVAKGIARCHAEDEYDKEFGISLANTRAWLKYYEKLAKSATKELQWAEEIRKFWEEDISRLTATKKLADTKFAEIKEEYDKMIGTI